MTVLGGCGHVHVAYEVDVEARVLDPFDIVALVAFLQESVVKVMSLESNVQ